MLGNDVNEARHRHWRHPGDHANLQTKYEPHSWTTKTNEANHQADVMVQAHPYFAADCLDKAVEKRNPEIAEVETQHHVCTRCDAKRSHDEVKQHQTEQQIISSKARTRKSFQKSDRENIEAEAQSKEFDQYTQLNNRAHSQEQWKQTKSFDNQHGWQQLDTMSLNDARSYNQQHPGWFPETREYYNSPTELADAAKVIDDDKIARNTNFNHFGHHGGNDHAISGGKLTQSRSLDSQNGWPMSGTANSDHVDSRRSHDHYQSNEFTGNTENGKGYKGQSSDQMTTSRVNNIDMKTRDGKTNGFSPYVHKRHMDSFEMRRPFQGQNGWQISDMSGSDDSGMGSVGGQNEWYKSEARTLSQIDAARSYGQHKQEWSSKNSDKARPFEGQSGWQKSDTRVSDNINTRSFGGLNEWHKSETRTSRQTDAARSNGHPEPRLSSETSGKARSVQWQNGWLKSDRKASDKISLGRWKKGPGYDIRPSDHIDAASMNTNDEKVSDVRSIQGTLDKSFDGHSKWRNVYSMASDHVDNLRLLDSNHQPEWTSDTIRGYENQAHSNTAHYNGHYQPGWGHNNLEMKQVDISFDSERRLIRSDGHQGEWNQDDKRAAEENELIRATSSANNTFENQATDNLGHVANKANEDQSQPYHGEINVVSPSGSGHQPHPKWDTDVQKYLAGNTHLQRQWQAHNSNMNSSKAHGNWEIGIHKDHQSNVAAPGTWKSEATSHVAGGKEQSDQGQNGRNPGYNGQQDDMSASGSGVQQNADDAKSTDEMKTTRKERQ